MEIARLSDCGSKSNFQISSIYHALRPHSALSPLPINETTAQAENENEIDWSQLLVSRIMPLVLPPEDLLNPCLNVLVSEIFSDMIIHKSVLGKISQPWLIWEGVTKAIYSLRSISQPTQGQETSPISRLDQYGLLSTEKNKKPESSSKQCMMVEAFRVAIWSSLYYIMIAWTIFRSLIAALMSSSSIAPRQIRAAPKRMIESWESTSMEATDGAQSTAVDNIVIRPLVSMRIWSCIAKLVSLEQHMPWLAGMASLLQWLSLNGPGRVCRANSALDRYVVSLFHYFALHGDSSHAKRRVAALIKCQSTHLYAASPQHLRLILVSDQATSRAPACNLSHLTVSSSNDMRRPACGHAPIVSAVWSRA